MPRHLVCLRRVRLAEHSSICSFYFWSKSWRDFSYYRSQSCRCSYSECKPSSHQKQRYYFSCMPSLYLVFSALEWCWLWIYLAGREIWTVSQGTVTYRQADLLCSQLGSASLMLRYSFYCSSIISRAVWSCRLWRNIQEFRWVRPSELEKWCVSTCTQSSHGRVAAVIYTRWGLWRQPGAHSLRQSSPSVSQLEWYISFGRRHRRLPESCQVFLGFPHFVLDFRADPSSVQLKDCLAWHLVCWLASWDFPYRHWAGRTSSKVVMNVRQMTIVGIATLFIVLEGAI